MIDRRSSDHITAEDVRQGMITLAKVMQVSRHKDALSVVYERLEKEYKMRLQKNSTVDRAAALLEALAAE